MYGHQQVRFPITLPTPPDDITALNIAFITMTYVLWHGFNPNKYVVGYYCAKCSTTFFGTEIEDLHHACTKQIRISLREPSCC
jgi:hypothetical protein